MKRITLLLIFTSLLFVQHLYATKSVWDGRSSDTSWYDENASEYHICSAAQFKGFADLVIYNYCSFEGKTIYLDCDVDLNNNYWSPIGLHSGKPFSGIFDGLNHSITNLLINNNHLDYPDVKDNIGLFGYAVKAEIKNLSVQGNLEISSGRYIGGVVAYAKRIENIYSDINIKLTASISGKIGNVVCYAEEANKIYSKGEIKFSDSYYGILDGSWVGGVAASCGKMHECLSCVDMHINRIGTNSQILIGGIAGQSTNISDIIFTGSIEVNNINCTSDQFIPQSGGICGILYGSGTNIISAPNFLSLGRGWASGKSIIIPSTSSDANISNAYYLNTWATGNESFGIPMSENELKSGNPINGFSEDKWLFTVGEYPSLKIFTTEDDDTGEINDVVINEENFPDAIFRAYLLQQDYGQDGVITKEEIPTISNINITGKNIYSLQGIEFFTSLQNLSCQNCKLESLNLANNKELVSLTCDYNQLTTLDISKCKKLFTIQCSKNNLSSLDLSNCPCLSSLTCNDNQLSTINLSGCTSLTQLLCYNNNLTELNLSDCTSLTGLTCYNNRIATLNLSCSLNLSNLDCNNNQLTSLNVTGCSLLTELDCTNNQLTTLDVSGCSLLTQLPCTKNKLLSIKVTGCTSLNSIRCFYNYISGNGMNDFIESLPRNEGSTIWFRCEDEPDGNKCSYEQVAAIQAKGWSILKGENSMWEPYEGTDDIIEEDIIDESGRINGVYYELDPNTQTAKVVYGKIKYSGDVVIKKSINIEGETYLVTSIGQSAFYQCDNLTSITLPNTIVKIGVSAFMQCTGLKSIVLPNTITAIEDQAFEGCTNLTTINLPNGLTSLSKGLFYNCKSLVAINIPSSVIEFKGIFSFPDEIDNPFEGCSSLASIIVEDGNPVYDSRNNCNAIIETSSNKLLCGCKETIIPNGVLEIGEHAFAGCTTLTKIIIPNSVKSIKDYAFMSCEGLSSVEVPNSVTEIWHGVFNGCSSLTTIALPKQISFWGSGVFARCYSLNKITLPHNIEEIGGSTFLGCTSLTSVVLPTNLKSINNYAFSGCTSLNAVYCYAEDVPSVTNVAFFNTPIQSATLYVPESAAEQYKVIEPWRSFGEIISVEQYKLIYMVDGTEYLTQNKVFGDIIIPEPTPIKEGYTFSGWSDIPETMPAHDVTVTGSFSVNSYTLTYMVDDKVYKETMYEYGATIIPEPQPEGDYATFEWTGLPENMPAHDVVVHASYTTGIIEVLMATQRNLRIYSPNGKKLNKLQKGLNIVVLDDGTVKRVVVK